MLLRLRKAFIFTVLSAGLILQPLVYAQPDNEPEPEEGTTENQEEPEFNRREATDLARKSYSGKVVSVRLVEGVWRVRMDDEGTIFNVHVNSTTGKVTRPD